MLEKFPSDSSPFFFIEPWDILANFIYFFLFSLRACFRSLSESRLVTIVIGAAGRKALWMIIHIFFNKWTDESGKNVYEEYETASANELLPKPGIEQGTFSLTLSQLSYFGWS